MLDLARANAARAGVENVEFVKGYLEEMALEDASVDVVISNCVINLSGDKPQVIREAARSSARMNERPSRSSASLWKMPEPGSSPPERVSIADARGS
jgi:Methyltransferase domain